MTDRIILTMKWGTLYNADYVNVLYRAIKANLTGPFRFVCLTDDATGILPDVETFPIPDIGLSDRHYKAGAWPKLTVFSHDLYGLKGRALFVDLDTVVWGNMDAFFEMDQELITLNLGPWRPKGRNPLTATGIFSFELGTLGDVLDRFAANIDGFVDQYDNEQDFLDGEAPAISYWPMEWFVSFKYHLRPPLILDRFQNPKPPEDHIKILLFHGRPRPIDLIHPPKGNWDRFPHYGRGKVDWMVDYWTQYGGDVSPSS